MDIMNSVALVTGANRGLGREFARQLRERGARTVHATARRPDGDEIRLDITDPAQVRAAAGQAPESVLSFHIYPGNGAYAAAKAAEWALTNSTRLELAGQGTHVLGAHLSSTDTRGVKARLAGPPDLMYPGVA